MIASLRPWLLAAAAALLAACGGSSTSAPPPPPGGVPLVAVNCAAGGATLEGAFKAPNATTAVGGATVSISSAGGCLATTNAEGKFKFTGVPATAATVTATKGNFSVSTAATPGGAAVQLVIPPNAAKLAYVAGSYDSIQTILDALGFEPAQLFEADLATTNLAQYDAVFLNCGLDESYINPYDPDVAYATTTALAAYVAGGGTLYASDWAATYVDATFPGKVNFQGGSADMAKIGDSTEAPVTASVLDASLRTALNATTARIQFDLGGWVVIDSAGPGTQVLITGPATYYGDTGLVTVTKPFAVQFASGSGRVTYTSFHNEAQATADMQRLLESMIFGL